MKKMQYLLTWKAIYTTLTAIVLLVGGLIVSLEKTPPAEFALGALAGPDIPSPYLKWGGVAFWPYQKSVATATTTLCTFTSPAATSTLSHASITLTTASTTAEVAVDVTKGAASGATGSSTAVFLDARIPASQGGTFYANPVSDLTEQGVSERAVFAPNTNLNFVMTNETDGNGAGVVAVGSCQANFIQAIY